MNDFVIIVAIGALFLLCWQCCEHITIKHKNRKFERECAERDAKRAEEIARLQQLKRVTYKAKK